MAVRPFPLLALVVLFLVVMGLGAAPAPPPQAGGPKRVQVGPNVTLEVEGKARRVIVPARVCLRKGHMEGLLTRAAKGKCKDHEYLLAADIDARHLHAALILAGARKGTPVRFDPRFAPPSGTPIKISLRYKKGGKSVTVPAGQWFRHVKTMKPLTRDWVFAGSGEGPNPRGKGSPYYMANHGAVISVCNVEAAVLDLPCRSPKPPNDRQWEANTDDIPENGTRVELILEPVPAKKR
jgi:hypothetical protein